MTLNEDGTVNVERRIQGIFPDDYKAYCRISILEPGRSPTQGNYRKRKQLIMSEGVHTSTYYYDYNFYDLTPPYTLEPDNRYWYSFRFYDGFVITQGRWTDVDF